MGALRAKMEQDLLIRGLSPLTQKIYIRAVVGLTTYYGRAPDTLRAERPSKCRGLRSQSSVFQWKIWIPATESGR